MLQSFALTLVFLVGCSTLRPPAYLALMDNQLALQRAPLPAVSVGAFSTQLEYEPLCRLAARIEPGPSVEAYVRNALVHELTLANVAPGPASITLTGELTDAAFDSARSGAFWRLGLRVRSSNGHSLQSATTIEFRTAFFGDSACEIVAQHFMPAVQLLVREVVMSPEFATLLAVGAS